MDRIDPELFARLMGLPEPARHDLLEFLGQTPVSQAELDRLIDLVEGQSDQPPKPLN